MVRIGWVHEQCNLLRARHGLLEELHAFGENVETHTKTQAGHVPARSREALDEAESDWITNRNRHDGYRASGLSGSHSRWRVRCDDDVYFCSTSSAALLASRSKLAPAKRNSKAISRPSTWPSSLRLWRKASVPGPSRGLEESQPIFICFALC